MFAVQVQYQNMSVKVFIPMLIKGNTFFDEVTNFSTCTFDYGNVDLDVSSYDVVLIHWPELLFKWAEPSTEQLIKLEKQFMAWRDIVKIVYVVHNEKPHFGNSPRFEKLYKLVLHHSHVMVHMGHYSMLKYQGLYTDKLHVYIPHPLYETTFTPYDKAFARKRLGISTYKKVVIAPGRIRNLKERDLIVSSFKALKVNNKHLIVPYMFKKKMPLNFKGSYRLQKIKFIRQLLDYFYNKESISSYQFNYKPANPDLLSLMLSAADIVLIPRINSLNSGALFLGLTFRKIIVGPSIGNIEEVLDRFKMPKFDPENVHFVERAMTKGFEIVESNYNYEEAFKTYLPKTIAKQWDDFLVSLL